jgi:beta-galactosidase
VERGGVLCLTARSGAADEYNTIFSEPSPGPLRQMAGIEIDEYGALPEPLSLWDEADEFEGNLKQAELWADEIVVTRARPVATYAEGWLADTPAVTVNEFGQGKVVYVGTVLTGETLEAFLEWLCRLAGVASVLDVPPGVRAFERRGNGRRFLFLLNFTDAPQSVGLEGDWEDAFTRGRAAAVEIPALDVRILTREE